MRIFKRYSVSQNDVILQEFTNIVDALLFSYGFDDFTIRTRHARPRFHCPKFDDSLSDDDKAVYYDSFFYQFVSLILTRRERDIFNKRFRQGGF